MPKGLYIYRCVFSFFLSTPNLRGHWTISTKRGHWTSYLLMTAIWKIWSELTRAFIPTVCGKKSAFCDRLWTLTEYISICLCNGTWYQQSERNLSLNLQGLSYMSSKFGELWPRNGWERLASFCPPPKFSHWRYYQPHGRYITDSTQQANFGTC